MTLPVILRTYVKLGFRPEIDRIVQDAAFGGTDFRHYFKESSTHEADMFIAISLVEGHIDRIQGDLVYFGLLAPLEFKSLNRP